MLRPGYARKGGQQMAILRHHTSKGNLPARLVDLTLLLVILLVGWVVVREVFHIGGAEREGREESFKVPVAITELELGQAQWRVGDVSLAKQGTIYEAHIVDAAGRGLFKLKVDATSGELLGKGQKPLAQSTASVLSATEIKASLEAVLGQLSPGEAQRKGKKPFYEVPLTYQGQEVARIKVDASSHQVIGEEPTRGKGPGEEAKKGGRPQKGKIIPKNLVVPLGWGSTLIMVVSSLYYSWKRSLYSPLRAAGGEAKARAIAALRRTLWWHMALGVAAVGIAVAHVLNFTARVQLSVSWLTLGMAFVVALSGAFGRFLARSEAVRQNWRRFHLPYTALFFIVLFIHILEKTKILAD